MNKYTKDPVKILISKLSWFYDACIQDGEPFKNQNEYDILKEILDVVEHNNPAKRKEPLRLIK